MIAKPSHPYLPPPPLRYRLGPWFHGRVRNGRSQLLLEYSSSMFYNNVLFLSSKAHEASPSTRNAIITLIVISFSWEYFEIVAAKMRFFVNFEHTFVDWLFVLSKIARFRNMNSLKYFLKKYLAFEGRWRNLGTLLVHRYLGRLKNGLTPFPEA